MALTPFNPFEEMETLEDRIIRLMEGTSLGLLAAAEATKEEAAGMTAQPWMPSVDIFEGDSEYIIKVELPDVDPKDVDLKIENNVLTIQGRRKLEHEDQKERYRLVESTYGEFSRSFSLPSSVEGSRADAKFDKGVLKVVLPKNPEARSRHISIKLS